MMERWVWLAALVTGAATAWGTSAVRAQSPDTTLSVDRLPTRAAASVELAPVGEAVCSNDAEGPDARARCLEVRLRVGSDAVRSALVDCYRTRVPFDAQVEGELTLAVEGDETGRLTRADALPGPTLAGHALAACAEGVMRELRFDPGPAFRAQQRWTFRLEHAEPIGSDRSTVRLLGELVLGGGAAIWPNETRGGYLLGVRAALLYAWYVGLSMSMDSTDALDDRPGAAVLWSARLITRPEHTLAAGYAIWGSIEAGVALSSGQGEDNAQRDDELAFSASLGLGARIERIFVVGLYVTDAISATTHRVGGHLSLGLDFGL